VIIKGGWMRRLVRVICMRRLVRAVVIVALVSAAFVSGRASAGPASGAPAPDWTFVKDPNNGVTYLVMQRELINIPYYPIPEELWGEFEPSRFWAIPESNGIGFGDCPYWYKSVCDPFGDIRFPLGDVVAVFEEEPPPPPQPILREREADPTSTPTATPTRTPTPTQTRTASR